MPYTKPKTKPTRYWWQTQNWYKNILVDATVLFELLQIWSVSSNELFTSQVRLYSEQIYCYWKPIDMKLEMCDANVQKHQFKNLPVY